MRLILTACALILASSSAAQTDRTPTFKVNPENGADRNDLFSEAISADGNRLAVGTPGDHADGKARAGSVYIYERRDTTWVQTERLTAPVPVEHGRCGEAIALDGNQLAITCRGENSAYLYTYDGTWALSESLRFRPGVPNAMSVDLQENHLVVGELGVYPEPDRIHVLEYGPSGWTPTDTLHAPPGVTGYGHWLDLDGNRIIVPTSYNLHIYEKQGPAWALSTILNADPSTSPYGFFGLSSLSGDRILAGALSRYTTTPPPSGYVLEWNGMEWIPTPLPPTPASRSNPLFTPTFIEGDRIAIGVTYSGANPPDHVLLFEAETEGWVLRDTVAMARPDTYDDQWDNIVLEGDFLFGGSKYGELFRQTRRSGTVQIVSLDSSRHRTVIASGALPTSEQMGRAISSDGFRLAVATLETTRIYRTTASEPVLEATLGEGGTSLAIDGTRLLIGNREDNQAFFYSLGPDGWTQNARLRGGNRFGTSVALDGSLALIGSPTPGAAEVRTYALGGTEWNQTGSLAPPDGTPHSDEFGTAVALDGGRALVGDPGISNANGSTGAAYIFELASGAWQVATRIQAPDATEGDQFGSAVALDGGLALVSAPQTSRLTNTPGAVYALTGEHWVPSPLPTDGQIGPRFGTTLALAGNRAAVGGYTGTALPSIPDRVITYAFRDGAWTQTEGLIPGDVPPASGFGTAIAIRGHTIWVGAPYDDWVGPDAGTVYMYEGPFAVETAEEPPIASSMLHPAAPNPFRDRSRLTLTLPTPEWVTVTIVDVRGRVVETLLPRQHRSGTLNLTVDGHHLAAGLYLVRAIGETFASTQRITILP